MSGNSQDFNRRRYLTGYESEIRVTAGISARWGGVESGVEFFGAWSNQGLPIIQLVVGPGPRAIHQPCHYEQDLQFFRRIHDFIVSEYGIEWNGGGHCHHTLGLLGPSSDDVRQVMGVTRRNGLDRWCEIITTFVNTDRYARMDGTLAGIPSGPGKSLRVLANAYLYTDPQNEERIQVPIRVLPGISPIRKAILGSGRLSPSDIGDYASHFPLGNILYESVGSETEHTDPAEEVFEAIAAQCQELPEEAQHGITLTALQDSVMVVLPLLNGAVAYVEYDRKPPHKIRGVRVQSDRDKTGDLTAVDVLGKRRVSTLNKIYRALISPGGTETRGSRSWSRMKVLFEAATHAATACVSRLKHEK